MPLLSRNVMQTNIPTIITASLFRTSIFEHNATTLVRKSWRELILRTVLCTAYIVLGAILFTMMESPNEQAILANLRSNRTKFLTDHPCLTEKSLEVFLRQVVNASKMGVYATNNATNPRVWSLSSSYLFTISFLTTVGYGNVSPLSHQGRLLALFYVLFGIPITLGFISAVVIKLVDTLNKYYVKMEKRSSYSKERFRRLFITCSGIALVAIIVILPATIFTITEPKWGFVESLYFCCSSITAVGLGDFVPGNEFGQRFSSIIKIATAHYIIVGITLLGLYVTFVWENPGTSKNQTEGSKAKLVVDGSTEK